MCIQYSTRPSETCRNPRRIIVVRRYCIKITVVRIPESDILIFQNIGNLAAYQKIVGYTYPAYRKRPLIRTPIRRVQPPFYVIIRPI